MNYRCRSGRSTANTMYETIRIENHEEASVLYFNRPDKLNGLTLDLTEGLLAANTWGILGFEPTYAQQLAKNLVLWSASGMKGE